MLGVSSRTFVIILAFGMLGPVSRARAQNFIEDSEMPISNWQAEVVSPMGGFAFSVGHSATGGNPGAYRTIAHTSVAGIASGYVVHRHAMTWVPALDGSIDSLDMRLDVNCINGGPSAAVGFGLVVIQDEQVYFGPQFTPLNNSGWRTDLMATVLTSTSFTAGTPTVNPDFSVNGSTISFGFYSSNGTGSGSPINSTSGADNFVVQIRSTPPPPPPVDAGVEPDAAEPDAGEPVDAEVMLDAEPADAEAMDAAPAMDATSAPDAEPAPDLGPRPDATASPDLGLRDAGAGRDASVAVDAGDSDSSDEGCGCSTSKSATTSEPLAALFLSGLLLLGAHRLRRSEARGISARRTKTE